MKRSKILEYKKYAEQSKWFDGKGIEQDKMIIELANALLESERMLEISRKDLVREVLK